MGYKSEKDRYSKTMAFRVREDTFNRWLQKSKQQRGTISSALREMFEKLIEEDV